LIWVDGREQKAQNQGTAWKLLPTSLGELPLDATPGEQVAPWPNVSRLWIKSSVPGGSDSRLRWVKRVLARQRHTDKTILWFDFSSTLSEPKPAYLTIREWAEAIGRKLGHDDDRNRLIRNAAQEIAADHEKGWKSLCSRAELILAMIEPPECEPEWLWSGLRDGSDACAIVLAKDYPENRAQESWRVDALTEGPATVDPNQANALAGLAVLSHPAARSDIQAASAQDPGKWIDGGILVETVSGCMMPASIAETVVSHLGPDALKDAHHLAYTFLDGMVAQRKMIEKPREDILLARWRHAQASQWPEAIRADVTNLLRLYARQDRAVAFLGILENAVSEQRFFPEELKINAAWAYLNMGNADAAKSWLNLLEPDDLEPVVASRWYATAAEVEKSSGQRGSKKEAQDYLEKALAALEGEQLDDAVRQRLRIRHDIARLVHFFGKEPQTAVPLYEQVATEWDAVPFAELDQAITRRNLAEALMDCSRLAEAEGELGRARRLIPNWTRHSVVAEVEYLDGRLAIRLNRGEAEIRRRFENCREMALQTNNMMMVAIVESRLFWRADPGQDSAGSFDDARWDVCAQRLSVFERHAWAARVQVDGRLRAARRLGKRGERIRALKELANAKRLIEKNPDFDQGSDQQRIVVLFSGLSLYENPGAWDQLKQQPWAEKWLSEYDEPKKAWELAG
jgi:tetratricopeptide (TPR) repeat protein